jgi:alpha-1,3-rhamnosyl/mannosyltransferase
MERIGIVYPAAQREFEPIPKEQARSTVAEMFGVSGDYVFCVGTIEPRKDHLTLLDAIKSVPDAPLLVLSGEKGWRCRHILAQIRAHEEAGRVRYLGRVSADLLPVLYSAAKLSVYPSLYEGFSLPVLESMACGCPVLCIWSSSLPGVGEKPPAVFRPRDADELAYRLSALLSDKDRLADMRAMGSVQAASFSFDRAAAQMARVLRGDRPALSSAAAMLDLDPTASPERKPEE